MPDGTGPLRSRRRFTRDVLTALALVGAVRVLRARDVLARADRATADGWLADVASLAAAVTDGAVDTRAWRRAMLRAGRSLPLADLLRRGDLDALAAPLRTIDAPEPQVALDLAPAAAGVASASLLGLVRRGHAIVPHGHHRMVSAHVVLRGVVHLRQYDRLADTTSHVVIRPRLHRVCRAGDVSAISADRGNVHWFRAREDTLVMIVGVYQVGPGSGAAARDYLDPLAAPPRADGSIRAPRLDAAEAWARYLTFAPTRRG